MEHLQTLLAAMDRERRAVVAEHDELKALALPVRRALGFSVYPLALESTELRSRGRVNVLLRGTDLGGVFTPGDPVLLGPVGGPDAGIAGRVEGLDDSTLELRVEAPPLGTGPWCVSRRLDFTVWEEQRAAVARGGEKPTALVNLLLGHERPYRPDPYEHRAFAKLDLSQRTAAELVLGATEIGLLHGPPGTGKTETLCAILVALRDLGERPWALAESNAAVDHLALRAAAAGLDVVRLGVSARISSPVQPLSLEWRILHGPRADVIRSLMRQAQKATGEEGLELRDAIRDEWAAAKREVLEAADVLAMTLGTLLTRGRALPAPRTAVVDEASQIAEPAIWPLVGRVKRLLLAGDPQQLGPVVKSRDPVLERSLLQRLVEAGFVFPMLTREYRFNGELLSLCAPTYGGRLEADVSVATARHSPAATWVDTAGLGYDEERESMGSFHNPGELSLLKKLWAELQAEGVAARDVAVITPYRAQLLRIRAAMPELESGTVNAFQGREKSVVLASFVRSNPEQDLGFVADPRRLNVTITRARDRLILVGDTATLAAHPAFARLIDAVSALGGYRSGWEFAD